MNLCFVKIQRERFCSENKGGKDVEGKIFADMLSGVWNDARPLEHNVGDTCKVVQCVILRALNVQLQPIAMSAMLQCAIMKRAIYMLGKLLDWQTGA